MPPAPASTSARARLLDALRPVAQACGVDLEDVTVTAAGRRTLVRVSVDADGGVDLERIAEISRRVSEALDAADAAVAGPYVLEVSSPGVDRPLTEPRHWRRNQGRLVTVAVSGTVVTGRIVEVSAAGVGGVVLDLHGVRREAGFADLGPGRVQVEFSRPGDTPDGDTPDDEEA